MRLALFVPDGIGVRNFVLGRVLKQMQKGERACVFHTVPDTLLPAICSGINGQADFQRLLPYHPSKADVFLRGTLGFSQMYWADTVAMRRMLDIPPKGTFRRRAMRRTQRLIGRLAASQPGIRTLERRHHSLVSSSDATRKYREVFERTRPTVLLCSHQRSVEVLPAVLAARQLGIPTVSFIFSWDNLTSKGRIVAPYEHYFVWSDFMRRELLQYYPHISEEAVHIVGTPQFETYADPKMLWSRDEFFTRIGGDQTRPLICYSGGDAGTCPEDPDHVAILMQLIRDGRVGRNPQVLVRPVPTEAGTRYAAVRKKYPEILWGLPQWHHAGQGEWSQVFPSHDDVKMLTNLTYYADINVNLGSTMTLDFGLRDKPVVNVAFDVADPPLFGMPVYDFYYEYEHFQPVLRFGATKIARSVQQFASYVNAYLENPSLDREGRRKLVDLEIGVPIAEATEQLLRALRKVSKES